MVRKIDFSSITEEIKKKDAKVEYTDPLKEKMYVPKLKDDGTFQAVIRFLPRSENDTDIIPYVQLNNHVFQTKHGGWFYENCPTTLGKHEKCPVCEENTKEWADESKREALRKRTRRISYYSNILVINDPQNPENNDKVFVFKYGKKIFDKIIEKISPDDNSIDDPVNIFDWHTGQNFKLKIKKVGSGAGGWPDYSQSEFTGNSTPIYNDESKMEELDKKLIPIGEITSKDKFKSYEELKSIFRKKMGNEDSNYSKPKTLENDRKYKEESEDEQENPKKQNNLKLDTIDFDDDDEFMKELDS